MVEKNIKNLHLDNIISLIGTIENRLNNIKDPYEIYIGITILKELCKRSINIECKEYDLHNKLTKLYNLKMEEIKELIGRTFLYILSNPSYPYMDHNTLRRNIREVFRGGLPYKSLERSKIEIEKSIYYLLKGIYQTVGARILKEFEDRKIIKVIKMRENKDDLVYIKILDKAKEYEKIIEENIEYFYETKNYD